MIDSIRIHVGDYKFHLERRSDGVVTLDRFDAFGLGLPKTEDDLVAREVIEDNRQHQPTMAKLLDAAVELLES